MMLFLKETTVSMRLPADSSEDEVEAAVRKNLEEYRLELPMVGGYMEAVRKGLAVVKKVVPAAKPEAGAVGSPEDTTMDEVKRKKQTVLSAHPEAPGAKVLGKRKEKESTSSRQSQRDDARAAAEKEKQSQERASQQAKRQRQADLAASSTGSPASGKARKPGGGLSKPADSGKSRDGDAGAADEPTE